MAEQALSTEEPDVKAALEAAESILALLHYRGIIDSPANRTDGEKALTAVRDALGSER